MRALILFACLSIVGCSGPEPAPAEVEAPGPTPAVQRTPMGDLPEIDAASVLAHTKVLASDEFEGRAPGTKGEALTVGYLVDQFQKIGLKPGNTNGAFIQKVPLVGTLTEPAPLVLTRGEQQLSLAFKDEMVAVNGLPAGPASIDNADVVFVGYGIVAPEYDWNDYKGLDVKGKTLLMLVNDPPVPDPTNPSELDPNTFDGRAMTVYGRWTDKFETASEQGAAGVFLIHEPESVGYPFDAVQASWTGEQLDLSASNRNPNRAPVEGWLALDPARRLLTFAGQDFDELKARAASRDFEPVPLGISSSITLESRSRKTESHNVLAKIEGRDPKLKDEYVVYMAHWDHLGVGEGTEGDRIYNGAIDNAVGIAGMLEIARAFVKLPEPPRRSILFLAVTGEEHGQLGSQYYALTPVYPLQKTVAVIEIDTLNVHGRTRDLALLGLGASDLDEYVREAAGEQGRIVRPDPEPERGVYDGSDHTSFTSQGVPALHPDLGMEFFGRPPEFGETLRRDYEASLHHKPSDSVASDWDMTGAREDLKVFFAVGYRVAEADTVPEWAPGHPLRARREAMLRK